MRKLAFSISENKDAEQLRSNSNCAADQRLCFHYIDSTIPLLSKSEIQAIFCESTAWFVSVLVGNTEDRFSHNEAHLTAYSMWHFNLMDRK